MTSNEQLARRTFLRGLVALCGVGVSELLLEQAGKAEKKGSQSDNAAKDWHFRVGGWTGDNFERGHQLRDCDLPAFPVESERSVEFAIVGGGIAGLTAAHYLRDHDFLLLEQYADLGGQSRGGSFQGIDYSWGPATINVPRDSMEELLDELNLSPVILSANRNRFYLNEKWVTDVEEADDSFHKDCRRLIEQASPIWRQIKETKPGIPLVDAQLLKLDATTFAQSLTGFNPQFMSWLDSMCRANNCLDIDNISALAGYIVAEDLVLPKAVFRGGNTAIARALVAAIRDQKHRCQNNAFVWSIEISNQGASIVYSDKNNSLHRVKCRHVIVTTPPLVSARTLKNVDNASKAKMLSFKYGSYLVANCLLTKAVFKGAFASWLARPLAFSNILIAETPYRQLDQYTGSMGSVLTVYQPYVPGSEGRSLLLEGESARFGRQISEGLNQFADDLPAVLEEIVLSRWGHAMVATNVGFFKRMSSLCASSDSQFSLAHNSSQGMPTAESAVAAARRAVDQALVKKQAVRRFYSAGSASG